MTKKKISALLAALLLTTSAVPMIGAESAYAATQLAAPTEVLLQPDRTVTWKAVDQASSYKINVYDASNDKLIGERTASYGSTKYALNDFLLQNGTYYVRMIAIGNSYTHTNSEQSAKSNTLTISIKMTLPAPETPVLSPEGLVTWKAGTNNGYVLNLYHAPSQTLVASKTLDKDVTSTDITSLIPALGSYYVKLIARGDSSKMEDSLESSASNARELAPAKRLSAPGSMSLTEKRLAKWDAVEGNNGYRITVYQAGTHAIVGFLQAPKDATQLDLSNLIRTSGEYYIRIQTLGANNSSSEDSAQSASVEYVLEDNLYVVPQDSMTVTTVTTDYALHTDVQVNEASVLGELSANSTLYNMLVPVKAEGADLSVQVHGKIVEQLLRHAKSSELRVRTPIGSLSIPAQQIALMAQARSLTLADHSIEFVLKQTAAARPSDFETTPLQLGIKLIDKNKQAIELTDSGAYFSLSVPVPAASATDLYALSGVRLTDQNGATTPVPTLFRKNADGSLTATYRYQGTATFAVKKRSVSFPDVQDSHYAYGSIQSLAAKSVIQGFEDGTFRPQDTVTRAQFAAMLVKALGIKENTSAVSSFTDVGADKWYNSVVNTTYQAKLISGRGAGIFAPEDLITAQEMATMVNTALRYAGFTKTLDSTTQVERLMQLPSTAGLFTYAEAPVALCIEEKILIGPTISNFQATKPADRAMAADMLYRMLKTVNFIN
ncbi:S-layer homology domain-containing protein [Tumebacillus lipolyticus]|uniref:S-layer homology domain-containing protein n=1 Tax=Tumebacillus lipolyticus TaxID=1280370 RepID=A0ABW5A0H6_9BACL